MASHDELLNRTMGASGLTLDRARSKLSGWHFAKECLDPQAVEVLAVAEAVLSELDRLNGGYTRVLLDDDDAKTIARTIEMLHRAPSDADLHPLADSY